MVIGIEAAHANKSERTGVEEYCYEVIVGLKNIIPESDQVILYCNEPLRPEFGALPSNWQVKVLSWPLKKLWSQLRLSFEMLFHKPDVFFAPGQLVPFFCPKNTITMVHDCAFLVFPKAYKFFGRQYLKWMNKRIIKVSSALLTSSEFNKNELIRLYGEKIKARIMVAPLAPKKIIPNPRFNLEKYDATRPYIFSVGRLETKKNTKQLVGIFTAIRGKMKVKLVLAGRPGFGFEEVLGAIENNPYKKDIIRLDYPNDKELAGFYKNASVFVFPSIYEGFGLPVLEALSFGIPVVASDIEVLHEVAGAEADYIDPLDTNTWVKIVSSYLDKPENTSAKEKRIARAALFSWDKTAQAVWFAINNKLL